jgi:uncharacterized membrane-anchored protein YjiN (DUF445 family)
MMSSALDPERQSLRRARAVATGMLVVAGALFVATLAVSSPAEWVLLLRAVTEAALVGGLADWFAVTALFRHPLGLPIPHTAIVPSNKDRIGEGLARFLDRHFLTRDLLVAELHELRLADRLAEWLADRRNAAALAGEIAKALPFVLNAIGDRQIAEFLTRALGEQLREAPLAGLAGRLLQILTAAGYHEAVLGRALDYAGDFLARNRERLLDAVAERRRGWMPRAINREIARAMLNGAAELIDDLRNPEGAARKTLLAGIGQAAAELIEAPPDAAAFDPARLLNQPELQAWIASSWDKGRELVLADLGAPASQMRRGLALAILSVGETLRADPEMRARFDGTVEAVLAEALPWRTEIIRFVTAVVRKWEPRTFTDRIEAAVGADLQYIRMNGTIVGGLVGGALYLLSVLAR